MTGFSTQQSKQNKKRSGSGLTIMKFRVSSENSD